MEHEAKCVACGCTDVKGCPAIPRQTAFALIWPSCSWLLVDRELGVGVCDRCARDRDEAAELLIEWMQQKFTHPVPRR